MKRRNILAALGTLSAGGALTVGSGAFTSVSAERAVTVDVVGDADALLRLASCAESGNDDYITNADDGPMQLDVSSSNDNIGGCGVNMEALSVFHNVFEICNQGTQPVCVDFAVDVPVIPNGADVPNRYDFEAGDLAVVFYRGDDPDNPINVDKLDTDREGAFPLAVGECHCVGFEVRAFGFDSETDLFEGTELDIHAQAGAKCGEGGTPAPELVKTWADSVVDYSPGEKKGGGDIDDGRDDPKDALGEEDGDFVSLGFGGELFVGFDDNLVKRPFDTDSCLIETTGGRDSYPEETADIEVRNADTEDWYYVGEATSEASNGKNTFEIPTEPVDRIRIIDTTDPADHNSQADGFDVAAVGGYTLKD